MNKKHYTDIEEIENKKEGFEGMFQRFLWSTDDGCQNFAMHLMEFKPHGQTFYHTHLEEHQFYFFEGEPEYVNAEGNEIRLKVGVTVYVPSDEPHQIKNVGDTAMKMLCMIPILPG